MILILLTIFTAACYFPKLAIFLLFLRFATTLLLLAVNLIPKNRQTKIENPFIKDDAFLVLNGFIIYAFFFSVFIPLNSLAEAMDRYVYFNFEGSIFRYFWNLIDQPWGGFYVILFYLILTNVRFNFISLISQPIYAAIIFIALAVSDLIRFVHGVHVDLIPLGAFGIYLVVTIFTRKFGTRSLNLFGEPSGMNFANAYFCVSTDKRQGHAPNVEVLWTDSLRLFKRLFFVVLLALVSATLTIVDSDEKYYSRRDQLPCTSSDSEIETWVKNNKLNPDRLGGRHEFDAVKEVKEFLQYKCTKKKGK